MALSRYHLTQLEGRYRIHSRFPPKFLGKSAVDLYHASSYVHLGCFLLAKKATHWGFAPLMGRDAGGAAPPTGLLLFAKKSNPLGFAKKSNSLGCFSWQGRWWGSAPDQWIRIIFDRGAAPKNVQNRHAGAAPRSARPFGHAIECT